MRTRATQLLLLLASVGTWPDVVAARVWYIKADGSGDAPTIQQAIDAAEPGDEVLVGAGAYTWSSQGGDSAAVNGPTMLSMRSGILLKSESGPNATWLDAEGKGRVIRCEATTSVHIEGFTIQGGYAAQVSGGPGAYSKGVGGGILCRYGSPIVIVGNVLRNNRAGYVGGAIAVLDCSPRIERNIIQRNQAQVRGGGVDASGAGTNAVVRANTIVENVGGGVSCVLSAATITENLITGSTYTSTGSGGWGTYCFEANVVLNCNNSWGNEESDVCSGGSGNISEDPLACITSAEYHVGPDSPCLPENNACGVLIGANGVGCTATDAASRTPLAEVRLSAWPNPFNPLTVIRFSVPAHRERVHVAVYDLRGRLVANLVDAPMLALKGSVAWDGIDEKGFPVGSGVYIARLVAGSYQTATRLVLIK